MGKIAVCLAGGLMLSVSARAGDVAPSGNPYGPIVARNVFGLNPPGPVDPTPPGDPPPKITPNGIMDIFGQLQVLFKVAPKPGQPGAKEASYVLAEGQRQDDIEVTEINEKAAVVTFNNHGTIQQIPLVVAPAISTPSVPSPGSQLIPAPRGGLPGHFGGNRPGGFGAGGRTSTGGGGNIATGGGSPSVGSPYGGSPMGSGNQTGVGGRPLTADEAELAVVANKYKAQLEGDPILPLFPPTSLDEPAGVPSNMAPP